MSAHMKKPLIKISVGKEIFKLPHKEAQAVLAIVKSINYSNYSKNKTAEVVYKEIAKTRPKGAVYLRGIRTRENMSQKKLEKITGIPASNISKYESGSRKITIPIAKKLAKALNINEKKLSS
ncbi:MAG: helix-turn-helix transcriptional regulator [Bdellovibrionales bacterium]|nr:helix-turn-helix transcriptional regulator [Bdellovibrionales bacterium]